MTVEFAFVLVDGIFLELRLLRKAKYGCVSFRVWWSIIGSAARDDIVEFVVFEGRDERVLFQLLLSSVPFQLLMSPTDLRNGRLKRGCSSGLA